MKKYIVLLLILVISALCGCAILEEPTEPTEPPEPTLSIEEIEKEENAVPRIGFSTTDDTIEEIFTIEQLQAWENPYEKYRSSVMFDTLSETEKTAYRAIEYAMANCYKYTYFDYRLGISVEEAEEAVRYLALDSFDYDNAEYTLRQLVYYTDTSLMINYFEVKDSKIVLFVYEQDYI